MAEPFGFFGLGSALEGTYLEDVNVSFLRGNIVFDSVYSVTEDTWTFAVKDSLFSQVYSRNADLVATFMSPTDMQHIRAPYYQDFILRCVERYDGDSDYGCTEASPDCYEAGDNLYPPWAGTGDEPVVKYWQMENEVDINSESGPSYWLDHPADYAELVNLVYPLVKQACPDCTVLLGSLVMDDLGHSFYNAFFQLTPQFDIFDMHRFGFNTNHFAGFRMRIDFLKEYDPTKPIWMTESSTYSDCPKMPDGTYWPCQSELEQATDLFKRYITPPSMGIERLLWNFLYERPGGAQEGCFWYTGLIYDGEGEFDKGAGVKKLSYFTKKLLVQKLGSADWQNIAYTKVAPAVYQYRFMVNGLPIYVVWYDWFRGEEDTKTVTLDVSDVSTPQVRVTEAVPAFDTGQEADTVLFEEAFASYATPITATRINITLRKRPVFIEETGADISVSPTSLDFGELPPGTSSPPMSVTISNSGEADLQLGTLSIIGTNAAEFTIQGDTCSDQILAPSETCVVDVVFSPISERLEGASLRIPSNDPYTPILDVPLSGGLAAPKVVITDAYVTDKNDVRKTTFKRREPIKLHVIYDVIGDPDTKYKVKGLFTAFPTYYPVIIKKDKQFPGTGYHMKVGLAYGIRIPANSAFGAIKTIKFKLKLIKDGVLLDKDKAIAEIVVFGRYDD
ncbi:MAG: choice-of-anchor D domain-containing protein [Thermodesulfobacteriota bacterium]|nr:choice-of-anchor D domain-containing protein [Thermodesulfobacteriota bacterium]